MKYSITGTYTEVATMSYMLPFKDKRESFQVVIAKIESDNISYVMTIGNYGSALYTGNQMMMFHYDTLEEVFGDLFIQTSNEVARRLAMHLEEEERMKKIAASLVEKKKDK